jgi:hypothetical protein
MKTIEITSPLSISTAGGEASFFDDEGNSFSNDVGRRRLSLVPGDKVTICGAFPKTHTFMVAIERVPEDSESGRPMLQGAVLRLASMEAVLGQEAAPEAEEAEEAEALES